MKSVLERLCALEEFIKGTRKKFEECSRKAGRLVRCQKTPTGKERIRRVPWGEKLGE